METLNGSIKMNGSWRNACPNEPGN